MKLLSVNVSLPKEITRQGKIVRTGIFKEPVKGRVKVKTLNIEGDGQADLMGHGGPFRAVYVYSFDNYAYWERELGRTDFNFGQFGENLTVEGMGMRRSMLETVPKKTKFSAALFPPCRLRFSPPIQCPLSVLD